MVTTLKNANEEGEGRQVMVHCYQDSRNIFIVSPLVDGTLVRRQSMTAHSDEGDDDLNSSHSSLVFLEVAPEELVDAPSAKFYPLLHELMRRGDMTATATTAFIQNERVTKVVKKSTELVEYSKETAADSVPSKDDVTSTVKSIIPKEEDVKQVYSMLRDEELTTLLEKGRDRLKQLVDKDVPEATKLALQKTGITIVSDEGKESTFSETMAKSQEKALAALEALMKEMDVDQSDLDNIRGTLEENFTTAFDTLSEAAKSDRALSSIFDAVSGKTFEWQEASGRLMSTKSASLFMEGASRLQARAASLFSKYELEWVGGMGSKFMKSFTEGDAATARLKSLELGDAVRSRLVNAIEVRSESHGGLDGIIAAALTTLNRGGESSGDEMQKMLATLQDTASSATKDAHETLISVLSQRSQYQDLALLRIESVLCDLESYLGDDLSPEEIASITRGEGGTSALFEPIARRAANEISKQLDVAEESVDDPTILGGLQNVRKIISGELTVAGLLDEVVNILNDDSVVAAGETFMKHGESVLDAIEGVSGNAVVDDVMGIAEKAGITKSLVMSQMEALNMDEILDTAGQAVTDEKARRELVSSATDVALDFILRILPSMPIPPFDGVKEGLLYHLSNLSMQGFKVKKENILVEVAGMRATKTAKPRNETRFYYNETTVNGRAPRSQELETSNAVDVDAIGRNEIPEIIVSPSNAVKLSELLIIEVKEISAVLDDALWSFEQTYMPYLKGSGRANCNLSDGNLRISFELRKMKNPENKWEPVLCMHDRSCSIKEIELTLQGDSKLTWIVNKLAAIFKNPLRDYVVKNIISVLTNKSGWILEKLNSNLAPYWGLILRTAGVSINDLVEVDSSVVTAAESSDDENLVELVWRQNLPLGMNLLLNDETGLLKVVDFPRGSQARVVCTERNFEPAAFNGSTIVAVNGKYHDTREELYEALKDPARPKAIMFRLAENEDAERVKRFVEASSPKGKRMMSSSQSSEEARQKNFYLQTATFTNEGEIGIQFASTIDDFGMVVNSFTTGEDGIVLAAERMSEISQGDLLTHINDKLVLGANGVGMKRALAILESDGQRRPLSLKFTQPYMTRELFEKPIDGLSEVGGPEEFSLVEKELPGGTKRVCVQRFDEVPGAAESSGVLIGDHLAFINGVPVGAGCRFLGDPSSPELREVYDMLRDPTSYPIGLTFARPTEGAKNRWGKESTEPFNIESAETIAVAAESFGELGCIFENKSGSSDIVLTDLFAVPGPCQNQMARYMDPRGMVYLSIENINGQIVPSYAGVDMVKNALQRSWKDTGKMEIVFCDDQRKKWVQSLT
jgi:hypothetical protein